MLSRKAAITNVIVFGLNWLGLEPTIYITPGDHASNITPPTQSTDMLFIVNIFIVYLSAFLLP